MNTQIKVEDLFAELSNDELDDYLLSLSDHELELRAALVRGATLAYPPTFVIPAAPDEKFPFQYLLEGFASSLSSGSGYGPEVSRIAPAAYHETQYEISATAVNDLLVRPLCDYMSRLAKDGVLSGVSPRDRYVHFEALVAADPAAFLGQYDQAWSFVGIRIDAARTFLDELSRRVTADWEELATHFAIKRDSVILTLTTGGDSHNGGRRVTILQTTCGRSIVYKPRSVDGESAYERLAPRLRALGIACSAATVLRRPGYGYMEFVFAIDQGATKNTTARQTGELAAVLYALNCRDMHFENIIMTSHGPIPVDIESCLHPHRLGSAVTTLLPVDAQTLLESSVYGVGVLPLIITKALDHGDIGYYDVGFLGQGRVVGGGPFKRYRLVNPFTDAMRCVFDREGPSESSSDAVGLSAIETQGLADAFVESFAGTYRKLVKHRDEFSACVTEEFANLELRYLHNPTILYTQVLHTLTSEAVGSNSELALFLSLRIGLNSPDLPALVAREAGAILRQDIPYFTLSSNEPVVKFAGKAVGRLAGTPLDIAVAKIDSLNEKDLQEQERLIRSAFNATVPDESLMPVLTDRTRAARGRSWSDVTRKLASGIADRALVDRFEHLPKTWLGPLASIDANRPWPPGVLGYDLYTGRLGIAVALASAARVLGDTSLEEVPRQIFNRSAEIVSAHSYEERNLEAVGGGAYTGLSGVLWALWAAGSVLEESSWCEVARERAADVMLASTAGIGGNELDLISGGLGELAVLAQIAPGSAATARAVGAVERALDAGKWRHSDAARQSGMAHGLSGVLFHISTAIPSQTILPFVEEIASEIGTFWVPERFNWRTNTATTRFAEGWCHGRSGVQLALAAAQHRLSSTDLSDNVLQSALRSEQESFGFNLTYCHGDLGNWDALSWIARNVDGRVEEVVNRVEDRLTPDIIGTKLLDRHSRYSLSDGLMVGTAGVLLHCARRIDRSVVISPTTLEVKI